jgi:hypothetical protein
VFHIAEICAFYSFLVNYFCTLKDFNRAAHYIDTLGVLTDPNEQLVLFMSEFVMMNVLKQELSPHHADLILTNCSGAMFKKFLESRYHYDGDDDDSDCDDDELEDFEEDEDDQE